MAQITSAYTTLFNVINTPQGIHKRPNGAIDCPCQHLPSPSFATTRPLQHRWSLVAYSWFPQQKRPSCNACTAPLQHSSESSLKVPFPQHDSSAAILEMARGTPPQQRYSQPGIFPEPHSLTQIKKPISTHVSTNVGTVPMASILIKHVRQI